MKGHSSSFLITQQSRYSEQLFAKSINRVRKRINILSSTNISTDISCPQNTNHKMSIKSSGLCATLAKFAFDIEMIQQDVRAQILQLKKSKKIVEIIAQDIKKKTSRTDQLMKYEISGLQRQLQSTISIAKQRNKKLVLECELRKQKNQKIKQKLGQAAKRLKKLQISLGCYTGSQKFQYI